MEEDKATLEERVLTRVLHLDAKVCGIVTGLLCSVGLFLATNWLVVKGGVRLGGMPPTERLGTRACPRGTLTAGRWAPR